MAMLSIENAQLVDGTTDAPRPVHLLIEDDRVKEISDQPINVGAHHNLDLKGRVLMPGLIDAHVHVNATTVALDRLMVTPASYVTAQAARLMKAMLMRGFTTVRDAAGADRGLADAVADGWLPGPRLFISGRALSQTGGHGDFRPRTASAGPITCACQSGVVEMGRIADGIDECRRAARDELRKGADQIKIMAGGGVASPTDPIQNTQYSEGEIRAIVEEAEAWNTYVMAHAYIPKAIIRAVQCGVRSIEHGNLLDEESARIMAEHGAWLVPTTITYHALHRHGEEYGLPRISRDKLKEVLEVGLRSIEIAQRAGVPMGHGSDLLGECQIYQSEEFSLKAEVLGNREAIRQALSGNAELMGRTGEIGTLEPGALADLIVVDGNPLEDIGILEGDGKHIALVMKGGQIVKDAR